MFYPWRTSLAWSSILALATLGTALLNAEKSHLQGCAGSRSSYDVI